VSRTVSYTFTFPLLAALALGSAGCRVREQAEGPYAFTLSSVEKDDCLLAPASGVLPGGDFFSTGNWVSIAYDWYDLTLAGAYFYAAFADTSPQRFYVDGSAQNVSADVGAVRCALDVATVHLEGTTDAPDRFHGTLRFRYESRQGPECQCESWLSFQAVQL